MEVAGDWEKGDTSGDTLRRALQKGTSHVVTHAVLLRRGVCCCPRRRVAIKPFSALALRSVGLFRKAYPILLKWQRVVPCRAVPCQCLNEKKDGKYSRLVLWLFLCVWKHRLSSKIVYPKSVFRFERTSLKSFLSRRVVLLLPYTD
jgi:hypothetical protein